MTMGPRMTMIHPTRMMIKPSDENPYAGQLANRLFICTLIHIFIILLDHRLFICTLLRIFII